MIGVQNIRRKCLFPIILLFGSTLFYITFDKRPYIHQKNNLFQSNQTLLVGEDDINVIQTDYKYQGGTKDVNILPLQGKCWLVSSQLKKLE